MENVFPFYGDATLITIVEMTVMNQLTFAEIKTAQQGKLIIGFEL